MTFYSNETGLLCFAAAFSPQHVYFYNIFSCHHDRYISQILKTLFTRVAAQSWCVVVGAIIEIQRVPVVLCGEAHNLDLK